MMLAAVVAEYDASGHGKKVPSYFGMQYDPIANTSCPSSPPVTSGFEAIRTCTLNTRTHPHTCTYIPTRTHTHATPTERSIHRVMLWS